MNFRSQIFIASNGATLPFVQEPMICPKCGYAQNDGLVECLRCGVIFDKIPSSGNVAAGSSPLGGGSAAAVTGHSSMLNLLLPVTEAPNPLFIGGRGLIFVGLFFWSLFFLFSSVASNTPGQSILHLVNLPFHEAGHIIFSPLGRFVQVLGGTLGQLLMPAICLGVLLLRTQDAFGAAVAMWWLAENFMDIAPYINDARSLDLILLGGVTGKDVAGYHDWEFLLGRLGLLRLDHALAFLAQGIGIVLMVVALLWAAANLWVQHKAYRERSI